MSTAARRILIADDETLFRQFLVKMVCDQPDFEVVAEAAGGVAAFEAFQEHQPEIVLTDMKMPDMSGEELTRKILEVAPKTSVILLTSSGDHELLMNLLSIGVRGFLKKTVETNLFLMAIRCVASGDVFVNARFDQAGDGSQAEKDRQRLNLLTDRELEILKAVALGGTNKGIADDHHISIKTVESHRAKIASKLNIHDIASLTRFAVRNGLVEL